MGEFWIMLLASALVGGAHLKSAFAAEALSNEERLFKANASSDKGLSFPQQLAPRPTLLRENGWEPPTGVRYIHDGHEYMLHPIQWGLPASFFVEAVGSKNRAFAQQIPLNKTSYVEKNWLEPGGASLQGTLNQAEMTYLMGYRESFFGVTRRRGGWDCLRHIEILASGCAPFWPDLALMPNSTGSFYPRDLILQAMRLPGLRIDPILLDVPKSLRLECLLPGE
jgi:hypothetical protein